MYFQWSETLRQGSVQAGSLPEPQSEFKASVGNLVGTSLKIKRKKQVVAIAQW